MQSAIDKFGAPVAESLPSFFKCFLFFQFPLINSQKKELNGLFSNRCPTLKSCTSVGLSILFLICNSARCIAQGTPKFVSFVEIKAYNERMGKRRSSLQKLARNLILQFCFLICDRRKFGICRTPRSTIYQTMKVADWVSKGIPFGVQGFREVDENLPKKTFDFVGR